MVIFPSSFFLVPLNLIHFEALILDEYNKWRLDHKK